MSALHTPGPWAVADIHKQDLFGNNGEAFVGSADRRICEVDCSTPFKRGQGYVTKCDERDANARLIAAAPELLDALDALLNASERHIFGDECIAERDVARAVIAKARGAA